MQLFFCLYPYMFPSVKIKSRNILQIAEQIASRKTNKVPP